MCDYSEVTIGLHNGLAPNRRQATFWINDAYMQH